LPTRCSARPAAVGELRGSPRAAGRAQPHRIVVFRTLRSDIGFFFLLNFLLKRTFALILVTDDESETTGDCARGKPQRSVGAALPPPEAAPPDGARRLPRASERRTDGRRDGGREPRGARPARPGPAPTAATAREGPGGAAGKPRPGQRPPRSAEPAVSGAGRHNGTGRDAAAAPCGEHCGRGPTPPEGTLRSGFGIFLFFCCCCFFFSFFFFLFFPL